MSSDRKRPKSVLDIGSNDGTQLKHYRELGYDVLGVESSKSTAALAEAAGIATLNEFFNLEVARRLARKFDVINAAGVFFHLEELHSVTEGIREALADDGVFVVQFLYMKRIMENVAFDQIYHEHLLYYNLATIETLLTRHGLSMFDAYVSPIHGGSVIGFVTHRGRRDASQRLAELRRAEDEAQSNDVATYHNFARRIEQMKQRDLAYLEAARRAGKRVFGMGAPVKGNTLLNYFGIGPRLIECLVEKNELRRGLFSPGMHLPVRIERELEAPPDIYYVLAWNFKQEILANNRPLIERGVEFYFPVEAE
ncbi:MAG TPA: class I SAM-dependent methyltransferase [Pirellulales bacterium]|nr:class I SAM-dependent methyltransferase [Pirellulales bacterium]